MAVARKHKKGSKAALKRPAFVSPGNGETARRALNLGQSFTFAWHGLRYLLRSQRNARIHAAAAAAVVAAALLLGLSALEIAIVLVVIGLVFVAELFNTALEALIDLATDEWHPLAKASKDLGAAAVLVAAVLAAVVGLLVFIPHIVEVATQLTRPA